MSPEHVRGDLQSGEKSERSNLGKFGDLLWQDLVGLDNASQEAVVVAVLRSLTSGDREPTGASVAGLARGGRAVAMIGALSEADRVQAELDLRQYLADLQRETK